MKNKDLSAFDSILQNKEDVLPNLKRMNLNEETDSDGFTLMQMSSRLINPAFVEILLEKNVNANISTNVEERPVLVAARHGRWKVLEAFRNHSKTPIDLSVWTKDNEDTILHLILNRSSLTKTSSEAAKQSEIIQPTLGEY